MVTGDKENHCQLPHTIPFQRNLFQCMWCYEKIFESFTMHEYNRIKDLILVTPHNRLMLTVQEFVF